jgi:hypothetical protein
MVKTFLKNLINAPYVQISLFFLDECENGYFVGYGKYHSF